VRVVVAALWLAGCGDGGDRGDGVVVADGGARDGQGDGGGDGPAPVPIDRLTTELGVAFCAKLYQCCGDNEIRQLLGMLGQRIKMSNCGALMPILLTAPVAELTYALTEGHISYRGERLPACLEAFRSRPCTEFARTLAANTVPFSPQPLPSVNLAIFECPAMIDPRQMPGQLCEADYECIASDCRGSASGDRRCLARSRQNEACGPAVDCQTGLHCPAETGTCQPNKDDGAACTLPTGKECKSGRCEPASTSGGGTSDAGASDAAVTDAGPARQCVPAMSPPTAALRCCGR
jgi:hypothetical protein